VTEKPMTKKKVAKKVIKKQTNKKRKSIMPVPTEELEVVKLLRAGCSHLASISRSLELLSQNMTLAEVEEEVTADEQQGQAAGDDWGFEDEADTVVYSKDDVTLALKEVSAVKGMDGAKALLRDFDAKSLSGVDESRYAEFVTACKEATGEDKSDDVASDLFG